MLKDYNPSYKFVIGSQYFIYFGVMGIFLPYFNLYCFHLGFSGFQIGILSASRSLVLILFPLLWGSLADRFQIRRALYIACNIISTALWAFYLYTTDFWFMMLVTVCYAIFYSPVIAFLEAFTMDILGREKNNYGHIRVWGSISFILVVIIIGKVIDNYPIKIILILILIGAGMQSVLSLRVPGITVDKKKLFFQQAKLFLNRRAIVFLLCGLLMLVSHGTYYGFFSIHLENLGYGNTFIGVTWALASVAEILVMVTSDRIFRRFTLENVLFFSFMAAVIRWTALFFFKSPVLIILAQMLHALSYGTFHIASILYIDLLAPNATKTLGQAVNNAVSYGVGLMIGFLINGYLFERVGTSGLFVLSSLIALAGGLLIKNVLSKDHEITRP